VVGDNHYNQTMPIVPSVSSNISSKDFRGFMRACTAERKKLYENRRGDVYIPPPKEYRMILDSLAGLKELCENKEAQGSPHIVTKDNACKNDLTEEIMAGLLHDAFESTANFMWHPPTHRYIKIYESQVSTEDHTMIFYEKVDDHKITVTRVPYEIRNFAIRMVRQCVNVTDLVGGKNNPAPSLVLGTPQTRSVKCRVYSTNIVYSD